ncbi:MAG: ribosome biogenesis GTPase YlqF [Firmicutes bacterium]|nr:ribosome biogenesis GTPase YlqF [Bacillota bacterium]
MEIQWFPGHMAKTRRKMQESIALVDLVVEVVDARIPYSSKNPYLDELWARRPRIIAMNKADLADPVCSADWARWYQNQGFGTVMIDALHGKGIRQIEPLALELCGDKLQRERERGREGRRLRLMVTGIPNVGKSTVINRLSGRAEAARTGNKPGVTRAEQWIRLGSQTELLDTPGILWPKFEDPEVGVRIACIGSIQDDILDIYTLSVKFLDLVRPRYASLLQERYRLTDEELSLTAEELHEAIGARRGFKLSGGRIDWERTSRMLLDEFRSGKIGRMTLELPPEAFPGKEEAGHAAQDDRGTDPEIS